MHPHTDELVFNKSSYSGGNGNCVEVARFRKSSFSGARTENCVEVADAPGMSAVRDTQNRDLGTLTFPSHEWSALLRASE
ncbi:DUF397 domain-containing protein [Nocardiopsis sp. NPDC058789]|uniref:DUF397 domain-containing protein n=1 Tax=Nocardiopsis sp. NPDC058789 TaxID=3346634 RepID=UPI00366AF0B6